MSFTSLFTAAVLLSAGLVSAVLPTDDFIVDVPLGVTINIANEATCPAPSAGDTVNANVLAVVTLDAVVEARLELFDALEIGANIDLDVDVCLCIDAAANVASITLPADLKAAAIADLTEVLDELDLGVVLPFVGKLGGLFGEDAVDIQISSTGKSVSRCDNCPASSTPTCVNASCSCQCKPGYMYNPVSNECVQSGSASKKRRDIARHANWRQAKRSDIEARIAAAHKQ